MNPTHYLRIWDSNGKQVYEDQVLYKSVISTSNWPAGLYHVQVEQDGKFGMRSWIKY